MPRKSVEVAPVAEAAPGPMEPIFVLKHEAARILGKCVRSIEHKIASGDLEAVKDGKSTLIRVASIRKHAATLPPATFRSPAKNAA